MRRSSIALAAALSLAGCSSPRENAAEQADTWQKTSAELVRETKGRKVREIAFCDAVPLMLEKNTDLRASRQAIITADAQIERVWLDMLPVTTMSYNIDRGMTQLCSGSDGQLTILTFINLPGIISARMRYYGAVLSKVRAEYAYRLAVRQKTVELWKTYRDWQRLSERKAWVSIARSREVPATSGGNAALLEYLSDFSIKREADGLHAQMSQLLGDYATAYVPVKAGTPTHDYLTKPLDPEDTLHVGLLQQKLNACELEGGRLQLLGATLAFWPDVNVGVSMPAVYSTGQNGTSFWNARDCRVSANATWNLDTGFRAVYSLNETKRQVGLMRAKLIERAQADARSLLDAAEQLKALKRRNEDVDRRLANTVSAPPVRNYAQFSAWSAELRSLIEERAALSSARDGLEAVFWFMDDARWSDDLPDERTDSDKALNMAAGDRLDPEESAKETEKVEAADMPSH